jgi:hypothetical protein
MDTALLRALVALVPTCMLFSGSALIYFKGKADWSILQLVGAGALVMVVLTHVCEALRLFSWMGWGLDHSVGHYLDLFAAVIGATFFPIGYLLYSLTEWTASRAAKESARAGKL